MGKATWACFDCCVAVRRSTQHARAVPCPQCGRACLCLGTKLRIPARSDEKAWQKLRTSVREGRLAAIEYTERMRVCHRHRLERQIADLQARPANEGRTKALRLLWDQLASL
jgi:hypothetical protein